MFLPKLFDGFPEMNPKQPRNGSLHTDLSRCHPSPQDFIKSPPLDTMRGGIAAPLSFAPAWKHSPRVGGLHALDGFSGLAASFRFPSTPTTCLNHGCRLVEANRLVKPWISRYSVNDILWVLFDMGQFLLFKHTHPNPAGDGEHQASHWSYFGEFPQYGDAKGHPFKRGPQKGVNLGSHRSNSLKS